MAILGTGLVTTDFLGNGDYGRSVTVQADGKILVAGDVAGNFALARYNADGSLDTSFSGDGLVTTDYGDYAVGYSATVQADGKILFAGTSGTDFALARYNADGSLDTSFSGDGLVTTDFGTSDSGCSVTLQADGKILVAGSSGGKLALARYNANGRLDTTFSADGRVTADFGYPVGNSVTVQADGKILVAGESGGKFGLARFNADGSLDTGFSGDGLVVTNFGDYAVGYSVAVQADGKILVTGYSGTDFALARYNTDGTLDTGFSGDGLVTTHFSYRVGDGGRSVTVQADGKILVAGTAETDFALVRYNTDGSLDTSFSGDGLVVTDFGGYSQDKGYSVTVQADGKILVAGSSNDNFALARYNSDGSLDTSFDGRNGNDTLNGDANANELVGLGGNDTLYGKGGNDTLWGGSGDDLLNGGTGIDTATYADSTAGVSVDLGLLTAQDTKGAGIDTLAGIEKLTGSSYADTLAGNNANNMLVGANGNDTLKGSGGADKLNGGAGSDKLSGGDGNDTLTGGTGKDAFVFDSAAGWDLITDFNHSQGDQIKLSQATFAAFGYTGALHADDFYAAAGATAAHDDTDRIIYDTTTGALYYDADGTGALASVQFAQLGNTAHPTVAYADFLIIA